MQQEDEFACLSALHAQNGPEDYGDLQARKTGKRLKDSHQKEPTSRSSTEVAAEFLESMQTFEQAEMPAAGEGGPLSFDLTQLLVWNFLPSSLAAWSREGFRMASCLFTTAGDTGIDAAQPAVCKTPPGVRKRKKSRRGREQMRK